MSYYRCFLYGDYVYGCDQFNCLGSLNWFDQEAHFSLSVHGACNSHVAHAYYPYDASLVHNSRDFISH